MSDHEECDCVVCYLDKRVDFQVGKKVSIQGYEVTAFYDASIVLDNGVPRAALAIRSTTKVKELLLIAQAYLSAAADMIGEEVKMPEVPHADKN